MLKQLVDLGLIDMQNGKISEEDKILLLHIYKSKLNGEQPDVKDAYAKYKSGQLTYDSLIDPTISYVSGGRFDKIIEFMHENVCYSEKIVSENIREARAFDAREEKMQSIQKILHEKLEKLHTLQSMLSGSKDNLKALCERFNMPATDESISKLSVGLKNQLDETTKDYTSNKLNVLCSAVNFIIKSDIRQKRYENSVSAG